MTSMRLMSAVTLLALAACSSDPRDDKPDASTDTQDAGHGANGPQPFPVARMDDGSLGFTHDSKFQGVVEGHSAATQTPGNFGDVHPARVLTVRESGTTEELYYTLPKPFTFNAPINDKVKVHYRERAESFGSSYGAKVEGYFGGLRVLFDEGTVGPAFDNAVDRLNFTIERDSQPLAEEADDCGRKVRYPAIIGQGEQRKRLFPGDSADYTLTDGGDAVTFTLLDLYRIEESSCGNAADFSVAYIIVPKM